MVGTAEYSLAKFLDNCIKPLIPNEFTASSTNDFLQQLRSFEFTGREKLVSFDVESLFTNVPLKETVNIITDYFFDQPRDPGFSRQIFKNML